MTFRLLLLLLISNISLGKKDIQTHYKSSWTSRQNVPTNDFYNLLNSINNNNAKSNVNNNNNNVNTNNFNDNNGADTLKTLLNQFNQNAQSENSALRNSFNQQPFQTNFDSNSSSRGGKKKDSAEIEEEILKELKKQTKKERKQAQPTTIRQRDGKLLSLENATIIVDPAAAKPAKQIIVIQEPQQEIIEEVIDDSTMIVKPASESPECNPPSTVVQTEQRASQPVVEQQVVEPPPVVMEPSPPPVIQTLPPGGVITQPQIDTTAPGGISQPQIGTNTIAQPLEQNVVNPPQIVVQPTVPTAITEPKVMAKIIVKTNNPNGIQNELLTATAPPKIIVQPTKITQTEIKVIAESPQILAQKIIEAMKIASSKPTPTWKASTTLVPSTLRKTSTNNRTPTPTPSREDDDEDQDDDEDEDPTEVIPSSSPTTKNKAASNNKKAPSSNQKSKPIKKKTKQKIKQIKNSEREKKGKYILIRNSKEVKEKASNLLGNPGDALLEPDTPTIAEPKSFEHNPSTKQEKSIRPQAVTSWDQHPSKQNTKSNTEPYSRIGTQTNLQLVVNPNTHGNFITQRNVGKRIFNIHKKIHKAISKLKKNASSNKITNKKKKIKVVKKINKQVKDALNELHLHRKHKERKTHHRVHRYKQ